VQTSHGDIFYTDIQTTATDDVSEDEPGIEERGAAATGENTTVDDGNPIQVRLDDVT